MEIIVFESEDSHMKCRITSVLVGIMFKKAFRILDDAGAIFDDILYEQGSNQFPNQYFPQIEYAGFQKVLRNDETGNYLNLFADNVVYCHNITSIGKTESEIDAVIQRVEKAIVPAVIDAHELAVSRLGFVYTVEITPDMLKKFKTKYFKDNVDVSAFRFSVSEGVENAIADKNMQDYYNTIYTISREKEKYQISFDFQQYFRPLKPNWHDCHSSSFFAKARKEFEEKLYKELE